MKLTIVIPAQAGIHIRWRCRTGWRSCLWIPASAGMTVSYSSGMTC